MFHVEHAKRQDRKEFEGIYNKVAKKVLAKTEIAYYVCSAVG